MDRLQGASRKRQERIAAETAVREFEEETGTTGLLKELQPECTLTGTVGSGRKQKRLEIFLQNGGDVDALTQFDMDKVVRIDAGYMQGQPEIVDIQWMTQKQALEGKVRIYKSQETILQQAQDFLLRRQPQPKANEPDAS